MLGIIKNALPLRYEFLVSSVFQSGRAVKRESGETPEQTRCCKLYTDCQQYSCHCILPIYKTIYGKDVW